MEAFEQSHICTGKSPIRGIPDQADLESNPPLWAQLWRSNRAELLAFWVDRHPGTRPPAFWKFQTAELPPRLTDESETSFLDRMHLLGDDELFAIRRKALDLVEYNRGRSRKQTAGGYYRDHFIEPSDLEVFAVDKGLVSLADAEVLGL
ncbi:MAG: hypothetical protein ACLQGP_39495 [Isosphaeraceae bacterium]